jgi:hypothetical protein
MRPTESFPPQNPDLAFDWVGMTNPREERPALPDRIRSILAARGLSLAEVSRSSRMLGAGNPLHHIPHNFYSAFRNREFSPSIYQVLSLSVLSGYQLADWLTVFGFSLDDVRRFQASFPPRRTVELDAKIYHAGAFLPWFDDLLPQDLSSSLVPLSRWLTPGAPQRLASLARAPSFRYFRIGSEDAFAFPELFPGSIVRVNRRVDATGGTPLGPFSAKSLFLVEHEGGVICSRLSRPEPRKIVLCSGHLPYAPVELEQGTEALVSGVVDLEIRPLGNFETPIVPAELGRFWLPAPLAKPSAAQTVGEFISRARKFSGLSFRAASARTKFISGRLGDPRARSTN